MNKTPTISRHKPKRFNMHPKLLGSLYILLGLIGLAFAAYSLLNNKPDIVPVFGTVMSGAFIGVLSIFVIIYGYRVFGKDYTPFI
jgi:hypothetical protein